MNTIEQLRTMTDQGARLVKVGVQMATIATGDAEKARLAVNAISVGHTLAQLAIDFAELAIGEGEISQESFDLIFAKGKVMDDKWDARIAEIKARIGAGEATG